jgi:hypothetical protein
MMQEPASLLMLQFLTWVNERPRTYAEAMDAWRSSCPRHTVWEDALVDGLVALEASAVVLTPKGRTLLECGGGTALD